jgi:hypothetical protein
MKPETEEFLYYLWWSVDGLLRPTWSNLNQSFEQWAWHNHLGHRVAELERRKRIERHSDRNVDRVVRLTDAAGGWHWARANPKPAGTVRGMKSGA